MADYPSATEMLVPNEYVFPNAEGHTRRFLVLHKSAGGSSAKEEAEYFQNGSDGRHVSSHYIVGQDGAIVQCVKEVDGASGNCCLEPGHAAYWPTDININLISFSIESVDASIENVTAMPAAQKNALFPLVKSICERHNIPMWAADIDGGIAGHNSLEPQSRGHCPGNFPWSELWDYLRPKEQPTSMSDHIVHLPQHFQYVYQFQAGRSQYTCVAACLSMIGQISYPGRWQSPVTLMHDIYSHFNGDDVPSNTNGMTHEQALEWLHSANIGAIDMNHLVSDPNALKAEIQAQNQQSVCQLITVADESKLKYAKNRTDRLHNWVDTGLSHAILRVGYSDTDAYGLYFEPAASLAFPHPLPILWEDIEASGIQTCLAAMPPGVGVPPANFSYQHGQWPAPRPSVNLDEAAHRIDVLIQELETASTALKMVKSDIGK